MAAPFSSVRRKAEDAVLALLVQVGGTTVTDPDLQKVKGLAGDTKLTTRRLEVVCDRSEAEVIANLPTGNSTVFGEIAHVTSYKETTRAEHLEVMAVVEDLLLRHPYELRQLFQALNLVDFAVIRFVPTEGRDESDGKQYRTVAEFEMLCAPRNMELPAEVAAWTGDA